MHSFYNFDFLGTISRELQDELEKLSVSILNAQTIEALITFQTQSNAKQGVYLLHYDAEPVYVGKADNIANRLKKHLRKLTGRQAIDAGKIGYKALLLDKSMSTAANEDLLIKLFRERHPGMWNSQGFGTNDPGQQRDTTRPGPFDTRHPIKADYPVPNIADNETVQTLLAKMQRALPYVCRFDLEGHGDVPVPLQGIEQTARSLMRVVVKTLGPGWKAGILSYGMVLYRNEKNYPFGEEITSE